MKKVILPIMLFAVFCLLFAGFALAERPGSNRRVFFIHHSTGEIYWEGGLKSKLLNAGYAARAPWWDENTDPGDFYDLFSDANSWDIIGDSDIILFKSCYPASEIGSKAELNQYKDWYRQLYNIYRAHPNRLFVPMSTPPLPKVLTNAADAKRAKKFDKWLKKGYISNYTGNNLIAFRLYKQLRNRKGYLKKKYVSDPYDGHPNYRSGKRVGNKVVKLLTRYFESSDAFVDEGLLTY